VRWLGDGILAASWWKIRVMNVPTILIADADGKIVRRVDGFDAGLPADLRHIAGK
jgi:hypothetical protein